MKANKIGTIFLVSVLALAGIGISYAGWIDEITVTGTVQTGYIEFEIIEYSGTWVWKYIPTHGKIVHTGPVAETDLNGNGLLDDDPVAYADGWYTNDDYELIAYSYAHNTIETANEIVHFKFINLYPCVYFHADFKFTIGTIPVILTTTDIDWLNQKIEGLATDWIEGLPNCDAPDVEIVLTDQAGNVIDLTADIIQLHPGTYTWDLIIHIPQCNAYMNAYAEGTVDLSIIQWNDECEPTTEDKVITIPTDPLFVTMRVYGPYPAGYGYFRTKLTNVPAGTWSPPIAEGANLVGWCVDNTPPANTISTNTPYKTYLYDSYNLPLPGTLPGGWADQPWMNDPDWPFVNWILNNKGSATPQQIQAAIWYFVDGGYSGGDAVVWALINGALNNPDGTNYVPPAGQTPPSVVAAICWVDASVHGQKQTTIIEVDP